MTTRISKIARLPANIREQLNERLHNGQFGRKILLWLNGLPETKEILAESFAGKAITHQNLSEWRRAGYQDWLLHQQRLDWFDHFTEREDELKQYDGCSDTYEAMSRYFVFEIGQAMRALQTIKDPAERWARLQNLNREFCRLQNSYNWSRRVALEYDKHNGPEPEEPVEAVNGTEEKLTTPNVLPPPSPPRSGGLELLGKQRKESVPPKRDGGPRGPSEAGASESLGRGEVVLRVQGKRNLKIVKTPPPKFNPTNQSARGLAHSKTLRALPKPKISAPASWTAPALYRFPTLTPPPRVNPSRPSPIFQLRTPNASLLTPNLKPQSATLFQPLHPPPHPHIHQSLKG